MGYHRPYKPKDFGFAQRLFALRKRAGLTQDDLALKIGVAEKTIRNWEGGYHYPTDVYFRRLIELYLNQHLFTPGHEEDEVRALWDQLHERAHHQKLLFDEQWFVALLKAWQERNTSETPSLDDHQLHVSLQPSEQTTSAIQSALSSVSTSRLLRGDWSEAIDVSAWCGRTNEVAELEQWLLQEQCRLVAVLGMGGIGKTALAVKLVRQVASHFECVLWRSLQNAPALEDVLRDWLSLLPEQHHTSLPQGEEQGIAFLIEQLQQRRCLLVLDNLETLFLSGRAEQQYRPGYEGYATLIRYVAETTHQSCLLLTSREISTELGMLIGEQAPVRILRLAGLTPSASQQLLQARGLFGEARNWQELVERYAGNPLALKIVAETVREIFDGDIAAFLAEGMTSLIGIRQVLAQQFERLSALEQEVLYWLAIAREPLSLGTLKDYVLHSTAKRKVMEALSSLRSRCLVERGERGAVFMLHPVILEYVVELLVVQVGKEICENQPMLLCQHALLLGQAKDYVRTSQKQLHLQPLLDHLLAHFGSLQRVEAQCDRVLQQLRAMPPAYQGYGGGNIINLLLLLDGHVRGKDCSCLTIWQADLQEGEAQDANFARSDLTGSAFLETIDSVMSVALSSNGQYLANGTNNGEIHVWRATDGQPLLYLRGHSRQTWSLAFHPENTWLISGGYDGLVKVWEVSSGQCVSTLHGHTKWVRSLAVHPAGKLLVTCGDDGSIRLWDLSTGDCIRVWDEQNSEVWSVAVSPDGRLLASGDTHGVVKVRDLEGQQCLWSRVAHKGTAIPSLAFSPDGGLLVSAGHDRVITLWEASSGEQLGILSGHTDLVESVAFNAEGLLASGSFDHTVKVWQIGQRAGDVRCLSTLHGHQNWVWSISCAPGGFLASGGHEGAVKIWQMNQGDKGGKCLRTLHGYSRKMSWVEFSPDGRLLASSENNGTIRIWETANGRCLNIFKQAGGSRSNGAAFCPDGRLFAHSLSDQTIKLWEVGSGQCLRILKGHQGEIWSLAFSPDGCFLASGSLDTTIKLWEVSSGICLATLQGHRNWVWSLAYSPDGVLLASGDTDGTVKLWEIGSGRCLHTLQGSPQAIVALTFTPDGTRLLSSNAQDLVTVWDVNNEYCLTTILGGEGSHWLRSVAFSPDGSLLAVISDGTIKVRNINSGEMRHTFLCRTGRPQSVAWSPDQRLLGTGTDEGSIIIWEQQTGKCLMTLQCERPYERMNISGITGITETQKTLLKALGAIE